MATVVDRDDEQVDLGQSLSNTIFKWCDRDFLWKDMDTRIQTLLFQPIRNFLWITVWEYKRQLDNYLVVDYFMSYFSKHPMDEKVTRFVYLHGNHNQ